MRKKEILLKIDELSQNLTNPDLKKTEALVSEILGFFEYIREKLQSPDPKDRESALKDVSEVQKKLQELSQRAVAATGMDPEELAAFSSNPENFVPKEWNQLKKIESNVRSFGKKNHKTQ